MLSRNLCLVGERFPQSEIEISRSRVGLHTATRQSLAIYEGGEEVRSLAHSLEGLRRDPLSGPSAGPFSVIRKGEYSFSFHRKREKDMETVEGGEER